MLSPTNRRTEKQVVLISSRIITVGEGSLTWQFAIMRVARYDDPQQSLHMTETSC